MENLLLANQTLKTIKYIVKGFNWTSAFVSPKWFFLMHLPYILKCLFSLLYTEAHKTLYWNSKVYDGMTRNDFKKGELIQLLYKIGAIKKYDWDHDDGRGYFIGLLEDE